FRGGVTVLRLASEAAVDRGGERGWHVGSCRRDGRSRARVARYEHRLQCRRLERRTPDEREVADSAEGVEIAASIDGLVRTLLRTHEGRSAEQLPLERQPIGHIGTIPRARD